MIGESGVEYGGLPVVVAGAGTSGAAAARALRELGARVTVVDTSPERAEQLRADGFVVVDVDEPPAGTALVVTSPGWRPDSPLLMAAGGRGIEVVGEVELAWRLGRQLRGKRAAPWLALTGTNGKTTTVRMLEAILTAAGLRAVAAGNVGLPLLEAVLAAEPYDVLAVELSSFQLHWSTSLRPVAAAVLNLADDHTDWHGSFAAYVNDKARIWTGSRGGVRVSADLSQVWGEGSVALKGPDANPMPIAVGNLDDPLVGRLLAMAPGEKVGFTLQAPREHELGVVEDLLVDRAFPDVANEATELASLNELTVPGAHNVANALAAAALARAHGVPASAVRAGLRAFSPDPHRNALVGTVDGVSWVDDSKATNPHAAAASLAAYDCVVWVAGGLLKGADVEDLVRDAAPRLRAVVLLGADRAVLADALARHAPEIPVVEVARLDTEAMSEVVTHARALAHPGDTVLLAPAAASMDCFRDYRERGELFAAAARGGAA